MRVPFYELFKQNPNGSYTTRCTVKIGGLNIRPGVSFITGIDFLTIDITQYAGKDLEVWRYPDGTVEITLVYR